jgi:hypothetical protein
MLDTNLWVAQVVELNLGFIYAAKANHFLMWKWECWTSIYYLYASWAMNMTENPVVHHLAVGTCKVLVM